MSDSNLSTQLLTDDQIDKPTDGHLTRIAEHFINKILPRGVYILNKLPTHFSPNSSPAKLDHIMTTHPVNLRDINLEFQETELHTGNHNTETNHFAGPLPNIETTDEPDIPVETKAVLPHPTAEPNHPRRSQRISQPSHKFLTGLLLESDDEEDE